MIDACMIVKDEQELLPGCLASLAGLAERVCVVDTGSRDRTLEILAEARCTVEHDPWRGDFSHHRNQSLFMASSPWVLVIDADERIGAHSGLTTWLGSLPSTVNAVAVTIINLGADGKEMSRAWQPRIFRKGTAAYVGKKHNQPRWDGMPTLMPSQVIIDHLGYGHVPGSTRRAAKRRRDLKMLQADLSAVPFDPQTYFWLAQALGEDEPSEVAKWLELYLPHRGQLGAEFMTGAWFSLGAAYLVQGRRQDCRALVRLGLRERPNPDLYWLLMRLGMESGDPCETVEGAMGHLSQAPLSGCRDVRFRGSNEALAITCFNLFHVGRNLSDFARSRLAGIPGQREIKEAIA
jgi:hypothetical protein